MILTFKVFKEKIESGDKSQTLRPYNEKQFKKLYNTYTNKKMFQLYWHNPRNGGKLIKERPPSEMPFTIKFTKLYNGNIVIALTSNGKPIEDLETFAKRDGFSGIVELFTWFYNEYGDEMYEKVFMCVRWVP
jgi:hypothetical protein